MTAGRVTGAWRGCIRLLRTDKVRVGFAERFVRAMLLAVPYLVGAVPLYVRAGIGRQVILDGRSEEGIKVRCHLPDIIQMYIYVFGTWEPDLGAFMRRRLRPGDTFIDIGANIGYQSAVASKLVGPNGTVIAIEPAPSTIAALQETIARNELTNVRLVAAAVSDHEGELPLFVGPNYGSGLTSTVAHNKILKEQDRVRAAPLGSLVSREQLASARLIKIDVEGAEDRVLAGIFASLDDLAEDTEIEVELTPKWWSDSDLLPIDVLRPFMDRGFHVYTLPYDYFPWRYLWPKAVGAPTRLRDLTVLERRGSKIYEIVLSRRDADEL